MQALNALTGHWSDFKGLVGTTDFGSIGKDLDQFMSSPAGKLEATWNRMKLAIAEALTPERIEAFGRGIEAILPIVEGVARGLGWIVDRIDDISSVGETTKTGMDWIERRKGELEAQGLSGNEATSQALAEHGGGGNIFQQPATQKLVADAASQQVLRELKKIGQVLGVPKADTVLKIDGNTAARAVSNAPRARQKS